MERRGLEVTSRLIETQTNNVQSSANILIERKELNPEDLKSCIKMIDEFKSAQIKKSYQDHLEKLITSKPENPSFNVHVWTDKNQNNNQAAYQIGEKITFFIRTEEDCYLTLLDINPRGKITVLFPNKHQKENFVNGGKTYQIPPKKFLGLKVKPPYGEDRLKAIATLDSSFPIELNLSENDFYIIQPGTSRGMRDIETLAAFFSSKENSDWSEARFKVFIQGKGNVFAPGSRKIPIPQ